MKAKVGDQVICRSNTVGAPDRLGEVRDTGPQGEPPFQVRWTDGHETLFTPGPDTEIQAKAKAKSGSKAKSKARS